MFKNMNVLRIYFKVLQFLKQLYIVIALEELMIYKKLWKQMGFLLKKFTEKCQTLKEKQHTKNLNVADVVY